MSVFKDLAKKALLHPTAERRMRELYRDGVREDTMKEFFEVLVRDRVWVYTLMKSGTTFMLNSIAAYRALRSVEATAEDFDFDRIHLFGVVRDEYPLQVRRVADFAARGVRVPSVIHQTHQRLDTDFDRAVLMIRRPHDFLVSSYHFHFKNRLRRSDKTFEEALPHMMGHYAELANAQSDILTRSDRPAMQVWYEDFIADPAAGLARVLEFVGDEVDLADAHRAVEMCSVDRLKKHERKVGQAIVATGNYTAKHFVRSGRVGEFRDAFTPAQIDLIDRALIREGLAHLTSDQSDDRGASGDMTLPKAS